MSHFFFCIKEYTNKQGSNGLSFSFNNQHNGRLFGDLFVVLYTIYNDGYLRHLSASLLTTFSATLNVVQYTVYNNTSLTFDTLVVFL